MLNVVGLQSGDGEKRNYLAHIVLVLILSVVFLYRSYGARAAGEAVGHIPGLPVIYRLAVLTDQMETMSKPQEQILSTHVDLDRSGP